MWNAYGRLARAPDLTAAAIRWAEQLARLAVGGRDIGAVPPLPGIMPRHREVQLTVPSVWIGATCGDFLMATDNCSVLSCAEYGDDPGSAGDAGGAAVPQQRLGSPRTARR